MAWEDLHNSRPQKLGAFRRGDLGHLISKKTLRQGELAVDKGKRKTNSAWDLTYNRIGAEVFTSIF